MIVAGVDVGSTATKAVLLDENRRILARALTETGANVVRAAETLHASDEYVGTLLAGSTWPALAAFLLGRWLTRRRQGLGLSPAGPAPAANGQRS